MPNLHALEPTDPESFVLGILGALLAPLRGWLPSTVILAPGSPRSDNLKTTDTVKRHERCMKEPRRLIMGEVYRGRTAIDDYEPPTVRVAYGRLDPLIVIAHQRCF